MRTPGNGSDSRARPGADGKRRPGRSVVVVCALLLTAIGASACQPAGQASGEGAKRKTPSGLDVPRYVSLKFNEVNARGGPGDDYKLLWTYRARGLPLQVIAETSD